MQGRAHGNGCGLQAGEQAFLSLPHPRGREGATLLLSSSPSLRPCHVALFTNLSFPLCPREVVGFHEHGGLVWGWSTPGRRASSLSFLKGTGPSRRALSFSCGLGASYPSDPLSLRPMSAALIPHSGLLPFPQLCSLLRAGPVEFGHHRLHLGGGAEPSSTHDPRPGPLPCPAPSQDPSGGASSASGANTMPLAFWSVTRGRRLHGAHSDA